MAGSNNWRTNQDMADWMRSQEKRLLHEERRPNIRTAADLLGPGIAPYSVWINDWNTDETAFNGYFHSDPGALNTPKSDRYWMGTSQSTPDGYGLQRVSEYLGAQAVTFWPRQTWVRRFQTLPGAQRTYSAWRIEDNTPPGVIAEYGGSTPNPQPFSLANDPSAWAPAGGWSIARQESRRIAANILFTDVEIIRTGAAITRPASGDLSNVLVATLSANYTPIVGQIALHSGQQGRAAHYNLYASNRQISMTSVGGTSDFAVGEDASFGGSIPVAAEAVDAPVGTAPAGWFYCNGAARTAESTPDLYAVIGTRYNTGGEAAGVFRLPNMPGKIIRA